MKKTYLFYLIFILSAFLPIKAQIQISPATRELLRTLDQMVANKAVYREQYEQALEEEKIAAQQLQGKEKQMACHRLFKKYARFQTDSAAIYLEKMGAIPPYNENLDHLLRIGKAEIYAVTGNYAEAENLFQQVNSERMAPATRLEYFHLCRTLYGWMADFTVQPAIKQKFTRLTHRYRDSILTHEPPGINRNIVRADSANVCHLPDLALQLSLSDTAHAERSELTFIHYNMAVAYGLKGDKDKQMYYFALTAMEDLRRGTAEYEALPRLAQLCYEANQVNRAYRYLVCTMEDASFCKARLRTVEVSNIFPIIDRAYKKEAAQRTKITHILIYGLGALALLLVVAVFNLRNQMLRLSATRKQLAIANRQLESSNRNLLATDKVKEEYIARYLDRCRSYIDTLEIFRRSLLKRFKAHQMEELYKDLKSEETIQGEQKRFFEEFDSTFLNLYPHFVEDFNALLQPDAQICPKGGELLTTELRIFALIRLGVTDSQRIAHFLNYSIATIYSYRSKIRNKALNDKNKFEEEVMGINGNVEERKVSKN